MISCHLLLTHGSGTEGACWVPYSHPCPSGASWDAEHQVFPSMSTDPGTLSAQHGGGDQLVLLAAQQQALPYHLCPCPGAAEGLRRAGQVRLREMQGHGSPAKSISLGQPSPTENQITGSETPRRSSLLRIGSRCRQSLLWEPPQRRWFGLTDTACLQVQPGLAAHHCAARQAGILHKHHEGAAGRPHRCLGCQEPQAHVAAHRVRGREDAYQLDVHLHVWLPEGKASPQPRPEAPPPRANLTSLRWWGGWGNGSLEKIWQASLLQGLIAFSGRQAGGPCCPLALVLKPSLGSSVWRSFRPLHS